jgi:hypothetical protein
MSPGYKNGEEEELEEEEEEEVKVKVLVVEDNMINRKILVKILSTKLVSRVAILGRRMRCWRFGVVLTVEGITLMIFLADRNTRGGRRCGCH